MHVTDGCAARVDPATCCGGIGSGFAGFCARGARQWEGATSAPEDSAACERREGQTGNAGNDPGQIFFAFRIAPGMVRADFNLEFVSDN